MDKAYGFTWPSCNMVIAFKLLEDARVIGECDGDGVTDSSGRMDKKKKSIKCKEKRGA